MNMKLIKRLGVGNDFVVSAPELWKLIMIDTFDNYLDIFESTHFL